MNIPISPWEYSAELMSPNHLVRALIDDSSEISMGGPVSGTLRLSNGFAVDSCNTSMIWSDDSKYLAVPQWTLGRQQRLLVISVHDRILGYAPEIYGVLELRFFSSGVIEGIDSPAFRPKQIQVHLNEIIWS
ncbi:MAG TPA: hypothetical protein VI756_21155 [Blastocatellia bacterium]